MNEIFDSTWLIEFEGRSINKDQIIRIHKALIKSGLEYTENGFDSFKRWELKATIKTEKSEYIISINPISNMVNGMWGLKIDKKSWMVSETWKATS